MQAEVVGTTSAIQGLELGPLGWLWGKLGGGMRTVSNNLKQEARRLENWGHSSSKWGLVQAMGLTWTQNLSQSGGCWLDTCGYVFLDEMCR